MPKKNKDGLGQSLIRDRFSKNRHKKFVEGNSMLHTAELNDGQDWGRLNLQSVTAESSLEEFISIAELAQREFAAVKIYHSYWRSFAHEPYVHNTQTSQINYEQALAVPRRPKWHPGISAEEQLARERESFLEWRRQQNELEKVLGSAVSPYERNIEVWRQLWRTLEKSDVVLLFLDARNPLMLRCLDLEQYATDENCKYILLLNKADLLTEYERKCWADYFTKENISIIFFSAAKEGKKSESEIKEEERLEKIELLTNELEEIDVAVCNTTDKINKIQERLDKIVECLRLGKPVDDYIPSVSAANDDAEEEKKKVEEEKKKDEEEKKKDEEEKENVEEENENELQNSDEIFNREQLLTVLRKMSVDKLKNPPRLTVGVIGYPNVGKSSTVNVIMQTKKVSVSAMPGHTRHIQSLILDDDLELLDCPGLVLPAYAVTPDLLITGVLPIDQMRSYDAAIARLCQLISKQAFAKKYGLLLPDDSREPNYRQILAAHALNRGFMSSAGQPDQSRSARVILKDASSGSLHWALLPAGVEPEPVDEATLVKINARREPTPREVMAVEGWMDESVRYRALYRKEELHKGRDKDQQASNSSKPWRREHKVKNKREKLRRIYASLDEH